MASEVAMTLFWQFFIANALLWVMIQARAGPIDCRLVRLAVSVPSFSLYGELPCQLVEHPPRGRPRAAHGLAPSFARIWDSNFSFRPSQPGWAFWKYFTEARQRLKSAAIDRIFPGPYDLVVDCFSMVELSDKLAIPKGQVLDFGTNDVVHYTNYFAFKKTVDYLVNALE